MKDTFFHIVIGEKSGIDIKLASSVKRKPESILNVYTLSNLIILFKIKTN